MKTPLRFFLLSLTGVASSILLPGFYAAAQTTVATDPVGFTTTSLLANSDTRVSIPFTRPAEFTGTISSISGSTITVAATPGWTANQFAYVPTTQPKTYYAIIGPNFAAVTGTVNVTNGSTAITGTGTAFTTQVVAGDELLVNGNVATVAAVTSANSLTLASNFIGPTASGATATFDHSPKEGSYYTVTANGTNSLTVNLNGDSLSTIATSIGNTSVTLIPYWTLGTAFPASDAGISYIASTGSSARTRATTILLPDLVSAGTDLLPRGSYYNYNGGWHPVGGDPAVSSDDTTLSPTSYFVVRNMNATTTFTPLGAVYMNRFSTPLDTQTNTAQDNAVAVPRPTAVTLNDLGLIASGAFIASTGTSARTRADSLLTYDNTQPGTDKLPNAVYFYYNGGWRSVGADPMTDYGTTLIPYGSGFMIRKAISNNGSTTFWQNTRNY